MEDLEQIESSDINRQGNSIREDEIDKIFNPFL